MVPAREAADRRGTVEGEGCAGVGLSAAINQWRCRSFCGVAVGANRCCKAKRCSSSTGVSGACGCGAALGRAA
eukprot:10981499-Ditylum_brightwellii.AAC.3